MGNLVFCKENMATSSHQTLYLPGYDMFIRLDARVKCCSQHKQEFCYEGKCTSVFKHYLISLHLSPKKVAGVQRIAMHYFLCKVKAMHNTVYVWQFLITMGCKNARKWELSLQVLLFTTSNFMLWPPILGCGGWFREFQSITQPNWLALGCVLVILND